MTKTIGNPGSWIVEEARIAGQHLGSVASRLGSEDTQHLPEIRRISVDDLRDCLRKGVEDFAACRSDVTFLCIFYPIMGIALAWIAFNANLLPLLFPVVSGFALVGPVAGVGLYEMSRMRELGEEPHWGHAFGVIKSRSFGSILLLGLMSGAIFVVWMLVAYSIYNVTLGPESPASPAAFVRDVLTTGPGWAMIILGTAVGFLFAGLVLTTSVVSFPLLLDRQVGLPVAVVTSMRVSALNKGPIAIWGLIVAAGLVLGSIPVFLGLIVVLPVLGHATWHLYRKTVVPAPHVEG
jgi:uncharacterized membrane protein